MNGNTGPDRLEERVRRALQHPASSADATRMLLEVHRGARIRRRRRAAVLAAAGVLAVVGSAAALNLGAPDPAREPGVTRGSERPSPPGPTSATERPTPSGRPRTTGFDVDPEGQVWRVGTVRCDGRSCARVSRADGAGGWETLVDLGPVDGEQVAGDLPPVEEVEVGASGADAWAFGRQLWVTHDGGATWTREAPGGSTAGDRVDVQPVGEDVFAVQAGPPRLWRSPTGADDWSEVSLPPGVDYVVDVTAFADTLVLTTEASDGVRGLAVSDDGGATWRTPAPPCAGEVPPYRSAGDTLWALCPSPSGAPRGDQVPQLVRSTDAEHWESFADIDLPDDTWLDATVPVDGDTVLVVTGEGGLLVTGEGQQTVPLDLGEGASVVAGEFPDADHGYLLVLPSRRLLATDDGGAGWSRIG